ncbi:MAG: inorganic pyrophosphatase [Bacteroidales bacterium]|nr:inorganic pyrophosphatase [Bacteroidales bacterium]
MQKKALDPIGTLMGLRYKSHPWHGIEIGENSPEIVTSFIEMVPTDTVKYEVDKTSGYLTIDRPQKFSSILPALYGFIPQTYCGNQLAEVSREKLKRPEIIGDGDPLDICILTEKEITHGDILVQARPIGGFRMIDGNEADDKIIAVLKGDAVYGDYKDISDCPKAVVDRLKHYFLTYKDMPGKHKHRCEITHTYNKEEAYDLIVRSERDYRNFIERTLFEQ